MSTSSSNAVAETKSCHFMPEKWWFHHGVHLYPIRTLDVSPWQSNFIQLHHSWAASCFAFPASCSSFWRKLAASARTWQWILDFESVYLIHPKYILPFFLQLWFVSHCFTMILHHVTQPAQWPRRHRPRTAFEAEPGWTHLLPWLYDTCSFFERHSLDEPCQSRSFKDFQHIYRRSFMFSVLPEAMMEAEAVVVGVRVRPFQERAAWRIRKVWFSHVFPRHWDLARLDS